MQETGEFHPFDNSAEGSATPEGTKEIWVFGFGSLIWKAGRRLPAHEIVSTGVLLELPQERQNIHTVCRL